MAPSRSRSSKEQDPGNFALLGRVINVDQLHLLLTHSLIDRTTHQLYQQTAILNLAAGNTHYLTQLSTYESMPDGKAKQDVAKQLNSILDTVIDNYAHAAGLSVGRAEYQTLLRQVLPDLTTYYKQRNDGSIKGLQQLIDRYKAR
jgi:hypothetical protein